MFSSLYDNFCCSVLALYHSCHILVPFIGHAKSKKRAFSGIIIIISIQGLMFGIPSNQ